MVHGLPPIRIRASGAPAPGFYNALMSDTDAAADKSACRIYECIADVMELT